MSSTDSIEVLLPPPTFRYTDFGAINSSLHPEHLQHLVAEVVDDLDSNAA